MSKILNLRSFAVQKVLAFIVKLGEKNAEHSEGKSKLLNLFSYFLVFLITASSIVRAEYQELPEEKCRVQFNGPELEFEYAPCMVDNAQQGHHELNFRRRKYSRLDCIVSRPTVCFMCTISISVTSKGL